MSHPPSPGSAQPDLAIDEVTAAKIALLRAAEPASGPDQTPTFVRQYPLAAIAGAVAAGALIGGVPIARKLLFTAAGFAGRNLLRKWLQK
jgi:hypothetical protein